MASEKHNGQSFLQIIYYTLYVNKNSKSRRFHCHSSTFKNLCHGICMHGLRCVYIQFCINVNKEKPRKFDARKGLAVPNEAVFAIILKFKHDFLSKLWEIRKGSIDTDLPLATAHGIIYLIMRVERELINVKTEKDLGSEKVFPRSFRNGSSRLHSTVILPAKWKRRRKWSWLRIK